MRKTVALVRQILLLAFLSLLLASLISYPIRPLTRWLPRGLSVVVVLTLMAGAATGFAWVTVPEISRQFNAAMERLPGAINQVNEWATRIRTQGPVAQTPQGSRIVHKLGDRVSHGIEQAAEALFPAAITAIGTAWAMLFVVVLAAYFSYQPESYREGLRALVPREHEQDFDEIYRRIAHGVRQWIGAVLIALAQSPRHMLLACGVYTAVHLFEGHVIQPLVMKRAMDLRPALLLIGQAVFGVLFGVVGVIVAAPLLLCCQILIQYFYIEKYLNASRIAPEA